MRWFYVPVASSLIDGSISCSLFQIYQYDSSSVALGGAHIAYSSGSYYIPVSKSLRIVSDNLISETQTIINSSEKPIDSSLPTREQLTSFGNKIVMFTDRSANSASTSGVRMMLYETGSWEDSYNWGVSTNQIRDTYVSESILHVAAYEAIRQYDSDFNYLGGLNFTNGTIIADVFKGNHYRINADTSPYQTFEKLDTSAGTWDIIGSTTAQHSNFVPDTSDDYLYIVSGSGDILRYDGINDPVLFIESTGSVSLENGSSGMYAFKNKMLYVTDNKDLVVFTSASQSPNVIHTFTENYFDMTINDESDIIILGYTDNTTPSNLYVLECEPQISASMTVKTRYNGTIDVRFDYEGVDTPVLTKDGVVQPTPTNSVDTWTWASVTFDGSESTLEFDVDDNDSISSTNGSLLTDTNMENFYADLRNVRTITNENGWYLDNNPWETVLLPNRIRHDSNREIDVRGNSTLAAGNTASFSSDVTWSETLISEFNQCHIDVGDMKFAGRLKLGAGGNTTTTVNSCNSIALPVSNSNEFTYLNLTAIYGPGTFDFSEWIGNFSGEFIFSCQGIGPKFVYLPPNIDEITTFEITNNRTLGSFTMSLDNGTGSCQRTVLYRNAQAFDPTYHPYFDLTNWNMESHFQAYNFGNDYAGKVYLAPTNSADFNFFEYSAIIDAPTIFDLSSWTGEFSGSFILSVLPGTENIVLPPTMSSFDNFTFNQISSYGDYPLDLSHISGTISNTRIYRNDNNVGSNRILTLSGSDLNFDDAFRVYSFSDTRPINWNQVNLLPTCSNDFSLFNLSNIGNTEIDLSSWTGELSSSTSDFIMYGNPNLATMSLGFSAAHANSVLIRRNPELDLYLPIGSQIKCESGGNHYIDFSMNSSSQANIDTMIDDIHTNSSSFTATNRFNFSRSSANSNNTTNIGSNENPSGPKIGLMESMSIDNGFVFNYWDGSSNIVIS
jgi:hypothetical protein